LEENHEKKLLVAVSLTVAAMVLVVVSVLGTIAYLTASSAVSNVFTVGNIQIKMFEHKVNSDGTLDDSMKEVDTNSYHLVPGKSYIKDPTIRILSKFQEDKMYLFVKSSNQIRTIEEGNVSTASDKKASMRAQTEANGWVQYVKSGDGIDIVWVYGTRQADGTIVPTPVDPTYKQTESSEPSEIKLFDHFTIDKDANVSLYAAAKVTLTGFAIQTAGMEDASAAWEAIKKTYPYEGGIINPVNPYTDDETVGPYTPVPQP
jgi:predicted ribosomally synthesized peptide with SipW-like signal peptide